MHVRKELKREGDWSLQQVQFVTSGGQVLSTTYEVQGPRTLFADRASAEAALRAQSAVRARGVRNRHEQDSGRRVSTSVRTPNPASRRSTHLIGWSGSGCHAMTVSHD